MTGCMAVAKKICEERNGYMFCQFDNPDNLIMHELTTGPELWE